MSTKFFTNNESNTLINIMEGVLANNGMINCFAAVMGYLRASHHTPSSAWARFFPVIKWARDVQYTEKKG